MANTLTQDDPSSHPNDITATSKSDPKPTTTNKDDELAKYWKNIATSKISRTVNSTSAETLLRNYDRTHLAPDLGHESEVEQIVRGVVSDLLDVKRSEWNEAKIPLVRPKGRTINIVTDGPMARKYREFIETELEVVCDDVKSATSFYLTYGGDGKRTDSFVIPLYGCGKRGRGIAQYMEPPEEPTDRNINWYKYTDYYE